MFKTWRNILFISIVSIFVVMIVCFPEEVREVFPTIGGPIAPAGN
ncbi:hypothetical protein BFRIPC_00086 (plasmid) [Peribacillus frigoritolerans]